MQNYMVNMRSRRASFTWSVNCFCRSVCGFRTINVFMA